MTVDSLRTRTAEVVPAKDFPELTTQLHAEASSMGWAPGQFPRAFSANRLLWRLVAYEFGENREVTAAMYQAEDASTLYQATVFND